MTAFFLKIGIILCVCMCVCVCVSLLMHSYRADRISKMQTIPGSLDIAVDNVPLEHPSMMMMSWFGCRVLNIEYLVGFFGWLVGWLVG